MATGTFDWQGAMNAGASEDDVLGELRKRHSDFDIDGALKSGASKQDVIKYLAQQQPKNPTFSWKDMFGTPMSAPRDANGKVSFGMGPSFNPDKGLTGQDILDYVKSGAKTGATMVAGMIPGMGAEALMAKLGIGELPALAQGLSRGAGGMFGVQAGNAASNLVQGKPPQQGATSPFNLTATALAGIAPSLAGLFAKTGSEGMAGQAKGLSDELNRVTGVDTSNIKPTAVPDTLGPVQSSIQRQAQVAHDTLINSGKQLSNDLVNKQLSHVNLRSQLRDALADQTTAIQTGNQQLQQTATAKVNALQTQMAQLKTNGANTFGNYIQMRNQLEDYMDEMERQFGQREALAMPEYIETKQTADQLKREYDDAKATIGVTASEGGEQMTAAKQLPLKVDTSKLPETAKVNSLQDAVDQINDEIATTKLLKKKIGTVSTLPPSVQQFPNAQNLYNDLKNVKTSSDFTDLLLEPNHLKVALAALPQDAESIKSGVFTALIQRSLTNGKLDPTKLKDVWLGDDGQGLQSLRLALGPVADSTEPLAQKISDFSKFAKDAQSQKSWAERFVKHGSTYLGIVATLGLGRALKEGNVGGLGDLAAEAAAGAATMGAAKGFNWMAQKFFTDDTFRKGAMEWAQGANVGRGSSDALRYFAAAMHASSTPQQQQ